MSGANDRSMEDWTGEIGDRWLAHLDTFESMIGPAGDALMRHAAFRPGERVVDIGCGGGATSIAIARAVGPQGRVTGIDVAPKLVARAQARAAKAGAANVRFEAADAQRAQPADAPFDRAFSRFGVMFFEDTEAAFRNIRSWLAPGGTVVFACWGPPQDNPWMGMIAELVSRHVTMPPRDPAAPGPFRLADPNATRGMLARAGFSDVRVDPWRGDQYIGGAGADPARATQFVMDGMGMGAIVAEQAPEKVEPVRREIEALLARQYRDGSVRAQAATWMISARRG